jgi:hypothetical protein
VHLNKNICHIDFLKNQNNFALINKLKEINNLALKLKNNKDSFLNRSYNFDSEWSLMTQAGEINSYDTQYISWIVDLGKIPVNFMEGIKTLILIKEIEADENNSVVWQFPVENLFYEIIDIDTQELVKHIILHASYYVDSTSSYEWYPLASPLQAKIKINIINTNSN